MKTSANDTRSTKLDKLSRTPWLTDAIMSYVKTAFAPRKGDDDDIEESGSNASSMISRTELGTNSNIVVVGRNINLLSHIGALSEASDFSPVHATMITEIVDAAVQHESPHTDTKHPLVIRNALRVPSMENNLIAPFVIMESDSIVKDTPKTHVDDFSVNEYSICFPVEDFRILLLLWGEFSCLRIHDRVWRL